MCLLFLATRNTRLQWLQNLQVFAQVHIAMQLPSLLNHQVEQLLKIATAYFASVYSMSCNVMSFCIHPIAVTGPPGDVSITVLNHEQLHVSWRAPPVSDQNGEITGYRLSVTEVITQTMWTQNTSDVTQLTLTGLHPNYQYLIQVAAISTAGQGKYSNTVSATTQPYGKKLKMY